jgi:predicted TIM-barrel fold metal-dependent hydrolase
MDVCQAGVKAYHRWLGDASSKAKERLLPIGILGSAPWRSMDEMLQELDFIADRGFVGTAIPGYASYHGELPLFDKYWDPFWARCEERGIALWVHAGHGERQGELGKVVHKFHRQVTEEGGDIEELVKRLVKEIFNGQLFSSAKPRRAMWQMMMGGVFDRFPRLKLVMNEVYGDWIPAMLRHLDGAFETHRAALPAKRKPSEYWQSNGVVCLSFIRKCEVALRREIGIDTVTFGRDYPHPEGTWPNTKLWLREAFDGVSADEIRKILTDNPFRHFRLDHAKLNAVAERIGPTMEEITGPGPALNPDLLAHFDSRGHILQEAEGESRIPETDAMMKEDLWRVGANA